MAKHKNEKRFRRLVIRRGGKDSYSPGLPREWEECWKCHGDGDCTKCDGFGKVLA